MKFIEHVFLAITDLRRYCSNEEYAALESGVKPFLKELMSLPVEEQARRVNEKYGPILDYVRDVQLAGYGRRINTKMKFFVILAILSLIVGFIASLP